MPVIKNNQSSQSFLDMIRNKTKDDLLTKLNKYGKCALVRCTGFGKTWMLADITTLFQKVLFLYPAKVIKNTAHSVIESVSEEEYKDEIRACFSNFDFRNIDFMTYAKLARMDLSAIQTLPDYDLIIMDECHRCGANLTKNNIQNLMLQKSDAKYIGATATPSRSDAFDVIDTFFDNIVTFEYTIHDAFCDGILQRPIYCFCSYDPVKDIKNIATEEALTAGEPIDNMIVQEVIKSSLLEISNLYNIPTIMKSVLDEHKNTDYMKFIVFFSSHTQLNNKLPDVIDWLKEAYPTHTINSLTISSECTEYVRNVDKLDTLTYKPETIDLISCVDMLNLGYHVENLTGIIMYRATSSSIIYVQQLGRALSTGSNEPCVVFDIVDNIHRKSIFDLSIQAARRPKKTTPKAPVLINIDVSSLSPKEIEEIKASYRQHMAENGETEEWWHFCNIFQPEDFVATGHYASYRELLAKLLAEPVIERAKRVQEEHRKLWCKINNIPYPMTRAAMLKHQNTPPALTKILPWQNITIRQYLDAIFPEDDDTKNGTGTDNNNTDPDE